MVATAVAVALALLVGPLPAASAAGATAHSAEARSQSAPLGTWSESGVTVAPTPDGGGYWIASTTGGVYDFGDARFFGSTGAMALNQPIVGMAATPDSAGYWLVAADGGIFKYGDARFFGSTGAMALNQPIVGMAATPDSAGYWLVAADGGIFNYGDARFFGSTGAMALNQPIVGMAATPDGAGYWLVAADGGIFSYGDARFFGSTGAMALNQPIVGMAATPDGAGYWLVAADGGIFSYGDARFFGSTGAMALNQPIVGMAATPDSAGYWLVAADGGIFNYGDARFHGSAAGDMDPLLIGQLADTDGAGQVVVVDAPSFASTTATLYTFERRGKVWYQAFDPMPAVDGASGWALGPDRVEGDDATPTGIYPFGADHVRDPARPGHPVPLPPAGMWGLVGRGRRRPGVQHLRARGLRDHPGLRRHIRGTVDRGERLPGHGGHRLQHAPHRAARRGDFPSRRHRPAHPGLRVTGPTRSGDRPGLAGPGRASGHRDGPRFGGAGLLTPREVGPPPARPAGCAIVRRHMGSGTDRRRRGCRLRCPGRWSGSWWWWPASPPGWGPRGPEAARRHPGPPHRPARGRCWSASAWGRPSVRQRAPG